MPQFKVIRASAGSGKTFNLTGEYLKVLFSESDSFMHILAVTFTNKATEEMKSRILRELFKLSSGEPSLQLNPLMAATGLSESQIRSKALIILKKILHHYSSFSVSTIDSFFQRIIRNFTRELGIQEGYAIELDTELVLTEIIDSLLSRAGEDKALLSWLTQFAESLIDKGESWNIQKGIFELGKEIFREEFKSLNDAAIKRFADREFLNNYLKNLHALVNRISKEYREIGHAGMEMIRESGLSVADFAYGNEGPAGFLNKVAEGSFPEPLARANQAALDPDKWYSKSSPHKNIIPELASHKLMPVMQKIIAFYQVNSTTYYTSRVILKNLYSLGILIDLSNLADSWCSDNNTFLLPEAPVFLNKIIDGNDTPFIYEKAGCWYHHFMIDEFQDTSYMQWLNFKPLISNSLSQNYDNLAVGDTKQSIYRWRNSDWDILESKVYSDFSSDIIHPVSLKENWRSLPEIITFNNQFFKTAAMLLQESFERTISSCKPELNLNLLPISRLYETVEQQTGNGASQGGYVNVEYVNADEEDGFSQKVNEKVLQLLYDLIGKGYRLNDIAILTRKNSEAASLADYILEHAQNCENRKIEVISDEALHLGSSVVVNTIVALLQYILNTEDKTNLYYLSSLCNNYILSSEISEWIHPGHTNDTAVQKLPVQFLELMKAVNSYSLIEICERIIKIFELEKHSGENVYLMAFRDMIIEYSNRSGTNIPGFIAYWNETGCEHSISAPAGQDAVRILTLHKSKGLEFKITIIPYCTWDLNTYNKSFLWCRPDQEPFDQLPLLPLNFTSTLEKTIFAKSYYQEIYEQYIDNLNLMYVAFTRAREALFIFCKAVDRDQLKTVSDLTCKILGNQNFVKGELKLCSNETGKGDAESLKVQYPLQQGVLSNISSRIKIAFQGELLIDPSVNKPLRPLNEGKILHDIFKLIRNRSDINDAVMALHLQGKIAAYEKEKYIRLINHAMNDVQVASWFSDDWNVMNEAEMILPGGIIKRPDRVMTRQHQTMLIDYKFGNKIDASYDSQLRDYAALLMEMGYTNVEAYLWYVRLEKVLAVSIP